METASDPALARRARIGYPHSANFAMPYTPCQKCGETKTETVEHGLLYSLARMSGYRLRMCSRCRHLRLIPRHPEAPHHIATGSADGSRSEGCFNSGVCPRCGSKNFRRSRRRWYEQVLRRSPMARCRACRARFPYPWVAPTRTE